MPRPIATRSPPRQAQAASPRGGSVDAQLSYLQTYWQNYNLAEWGDYNPLGGDCVNFTSQGLIHRGWQMDAQWKSPGADGMASKPWISTTAMEAYLKAQGFVSNDNDHLDRVRPGDVGIFDWGEKGPGVDHTMTVSKVEYTEAGPVVYSSATTPTATTANSSTRSSLSTRTRRGARYYSIP